MIKLLVLPEAVFDQYKTDGVQFNKLLCTEYMVSVSSVNDLAEIHLSLEEFPFDFSKQTPIEKADSPFVEIALTATDDNAVNQFTMQDLYNRLEERLETINLRKSGKEQLGAVYYLYPVDENLWVAVQKSLHDDKGDPKQLSIKYNRNFFDSMINELTRTSSFEEVAKTNLFTYYLESQD